MQSMSRAAQAYQASSAHRNLREQEADIIRQTIGALRSARVQGLIPQVKALADNRRLWMTIIDLVSEPTNSLPDKLRASIVSVGLAVQREMDKDQPNFDFLIGINENIAAGLTGG
jgi:flagellar biosynthesis activator protein FlaF